MGGGRTFCGAAHSSVTAISLEGKAFRLKCEIHLSLSDQIREDCESRMDIRIHPAWFRWGNVFPDISWQRLRLHEQERAETLVRRKIVRFCRHPLLKGPVDGPRLSRRRSFLLGMVTHYVCDFSCFVHTGRFTGTLKEHRAYEEAQAAYLGQQHVREEALFHEAHNAMELGARLAAVLDFREADSFSPEQDLEYALALASGLCREMLRLSQCGQAPLAPFRYRLPVVGRRLWNRASPQPL